MKQYLLEVTAERLDDGRFLASATNLQGARAEGDTLADAIENLEDVARVIIDLCREKNLPLPEEFAGSHDTPLIKTQVLVQIEFEVLRVDSQASPAGSRILSPSTRKP